MEPTGRTVAANIERIRRLVGMDLRALESELVKIGHRISLSALSRIENGERKVSTDDLMALAVALDTSPLALLLPETRRDPFEHVAATGVTRSALDLWFWAVGVESLEQVKSESEEDYIARLKNFGARSMPPWIAISADVSVWRSTTEEPPLPDWLHDVEH